MKSCLNRIGVILGVQMVSLESSDDLVSQVDRLQHANRDLREDNRELDRMLQDLRLNQNNQADVGRTMSQDQDAQLRRIIHETEQRFNQVEAENRKLRDELDKRDAVQGSVQSHNKLYLERVQDLEQEANSLKTQIANLKQQLREQEAEQSRLREEANMYKGRCANLQRDMEFSSTAMDKLNTNKDSLDVQLNHYKQRVAQLEEENVRLTEEKTDQFYEVRRLTNELEKAQKNYEQLQKESLKSQGDQYVSNATVTRLQTQANQAQKDLELLSNQKVELEKIIRKQKEDLVEEQNKATEYYNQLLSTKENFQMLHNEQKMLSDELTEKHKEIQQIEKIKLQQERELLQLRPLKAQLEQVDETNRSKIQENVQTQYERQRLSKQVVELQNEVDRLKSNNEELTTENFTLTEQNALLVE